MRRLGQCEPVIPAELEGAPDEIHLLSRQGLVIPRRGVAAATEGVSGVADLMAGPMALDQASAVPPGLHPGGPSRRWSQLGKQVLRWSLLQSGQGLVLA